MLSRSLSTQGVWALRRCMSAALLEVFRLAPPAAPLSGGTCEVLACNVCIRPAARNLLKVCLGWAAAASHMLHSTPLRPLVSNQNFHMMCGVRERMQNGPDSA